MVLSRQDKGYKAMGRAIRSGRLKDLPEQINNLHHKIKHIFWEGIDYVRQCGELLIEAKTLRKFGTWKKWLRDNFDGSYETAVVYMRIAREWDSVTIKEARAAGLPLDSIKSVSEILRNKRLRPDKILTESQQKEFDQKREYLHAAIDEKLNKLDSTEFKILFNNFDHFWIKLYAELKSVICIVLEYDPYTDEKESEELKKESRQKVKQTLSGNKKDL